MSNGNTWPSYQMPPYAFNMPTQQTSFNPTGFQGPYGFNPPPMASSGGGGWLSNMAGPAGAGFMMGGPAGAAIGAGLGLLGGIFGGIASGGKRKKARKALEQGQRSYQSRAESLFPELSRESFQYQNPAINNAIQAALAYRMGNMFGNWGMPPDMRGGMGQMNQFFQNMMPQLPQTGQMPMLPPAQTPRQGVGRGKRGDAGGWYDEYTGKRDRRQAF